MQSYTLTGFSSLDLATIFFFFHNELKKKKWAYVKKRLSSDYYCNPSLYMFQFEIIFNGEYT